VSPSSCASGFCASGVCCDSVCGASCMACDQVPAGTCVTAKFGTPCGPYRCTGTSTTCPASCNLDTDCAKGFYCSAGACSEARPLGVACGFGTECQSRFCADQVCCDSACAGPCAHCDSKGHCIQSTSGDPRGQCGAGPACGGECGFDHLCHFPGPEKRCDVCKVCNGARQCNQVPPNGDDPACSVIACGALSTDCRQADELTDHRCVSLGLCATPNDPNTCTRFHNLLDGNRCSGGFCQSGDCVAAADGGPSVGARGCGCSGSSAAATQTPALLLLASVRCLFRRRSRAALRSCS
jgi:hypothetical protein